MTLNEAYNQVIEELEQELKPKWIPVSEKLPEYGIAVLTINTENTYKINRIIDDECGEWLYNGVLAWMPLLDYEVKRDIKKMTREEAIKIIDSGKDFFYDKKYVEALDMAIEALKQEPCKDTISRQAAINAMIKLEQDDIEQYGCKILEGFDSDPAVDALEKLPLVMSQQKEGKWITHPKSIYAHLVCNNCLSRAPYDCHTNYCPNCGQRMSKELRHQAKY